MAIEQEERQLAELISRIVQTKLILTNSFVDNFLSGIIPLGRSLSALLVSKSDLILVLQIYDGVLKDARTALAGRSELSGLDIDHRPTEGELSRLGARIGWWRRLSRQLTILKNALDGYATGLTVSIETLQEMSRLKERTRFQALAIFLIIGGFAAMFASSIYLPPGGTSTVEVLGAKVATGNLGLIALVMGVALIGALLVRKK
jgi:hypothetical protein